jgi:hypothetical protein
MSGALSDRAGVAPVGAMASTSPAEGRTLHPNENCPRNRDSLRLPAWDGSLVDPFGGGECVGGLEVERAARRELRSRVSSAFSSQPSCGHSRPEGIARTGGYTAKTRSDKEHCDSGHGILHFTRVKSPPAARKWRHDNDILCCGPARRDFSIPRPSRLTTPPTPRRTLRLQRSRRMRSNDRSRGQDQPVVVSRLPAR